MSDYEPPTVPNGQMGMELYELFPGVRGYAIESDGKIYIPIVKAVKEGNGDVSKFLDACSQRCTFPNIVSGKFKAMLARHGYIETHEWDWKFEQWVDVWFKKGSLVKP